MNHPKSIDDYSHKVRMSVPEIANILGVSISTVERILRRAKQKMKIANPKLREYLD